MGLPVGVGEVAAAQVGCESLPDRPVPATPLHIPASSFSLSLSLILGCLSFH